MVDLKLWIGTEQFASAAGMTDRGARKVLSKAMGGVAWKEHKLEVRATHGAGGKRGSCYQVNVGSLPAALRARVAMPVQSQLPLIILSASDKTWKRSLLAPILAAGPTGSSLRADAVRRVAASARYPVGRRKGNAIPERTLRAWVAAYERKGDAGIARARRADRGKDRTIVSREWDAVMEAAGLSLDRQVELADEASRWLKGLWARGASSASNVLFAAQPKLREIALKAVPGLERAQLDKICRLPGGFVRRHQLARKAHQKRTDAGGHASKMVPRIHRDYSKLKPLEMVAADVRHSDIAYSRADGSEATAKMIVFIDMATNRTFSRVHLMNKGEIIRREHVLQAFRDLFCDPSWGVPQQLYLDNGGEFRTGPAADDLAAIAQLVRDTSAIEMGLFDIRQLPAKTGRLHSKPYTPQSKGIEGHFSNRTRSIEPMWPGFFGGNRMAKKVENQGQKKVPMQGDEAAIQGEYRGMNAFYNAKRQQRGHIKGSSPNEAFASHVEAGWQSVVLLPGEFTLAFGNEHFRRVQTGGEFQFDGKLYRHDDLLIRVDDRIRIRVPILDAGGRIPVLDDKGQVICVAALAKRYGLRDIEGSKEQGRQNKVLNAQIAAACEGAAKLDVVAEIGRAVAQMPAVPVPQQLATISVHPVLRQAAIEAEAVDVPQADPAPSKRSALAKSALFLQQSNEALRRAG